jgi:hypothetical protein
MTGDEGSVEAIFAVGKQLIFSLEGCRLIAVEEAHYDEGV